MKLSHLPYRRTFAIKGLYKSKYQHNECNGFCMFLSTLSNDYFCSLHKVAIDLNLPIYKVKSFDCFIEPLEIMRLDNNNMFIAVISQRNVKIGSWGNALPCVDNPISGSPLIIDSLKDVIITIFGADFYKKLRQIIYQRKGKVISMEMTDGGWGYLYSKSSIEAKKEIENYANKYITPLFKQFPELYNNIYLALRKEGFFAYAKPVLHIVILKGIMQVYSEPHLRIITAHELMHLVQYINGIALGRWKIQYERQATFLAFARGFSYDFVCAFPNYCNKILCDMNTKICYFKCKDVFTHPCKTYTQNELSILADKINLLLKNTLLMISWIT